MNKCGNCNRDLKSSEIPAFFDGLCKECWNRKQFKAYPFKKGISDKDQQIAELKEKLESTEQLRQEALEEGIKCVERDKETILNLQEELKGKDNLIRTLKELWKEDKEKISNYKTDLYGLEKSVEEIKKIKLKPEEKEIYVKGFERCEEQCASQIAGLTLENKQFKRQLRKQNKEILKLKQCLDKLLQPTCTYDEIREIIVEDEEEAKDWAIKMLNNDLKILPREIIEKIKEIVLYLSTATYCEKCGNITTNNYIETDMLVDKLNIVLKDYEEIYG